MTQSAILQIQVDESQPIRVDSPKVTLIIRNNSSDLYSNVNIEFEHRRDIRLYPAKIHLARLAPGPADIKKVLYLQTYAAGSYVIRGRANYFVEGRDRHAKAMEVELHIKVEPVMAPERQRIEPIKVPNLTDKVTLPGKTSISNSITDKPDRYADLKDSLHKGNVVAFVGAGFSIGAGLPGWYSLIGELAQRIGYELPPAQWATGEALIDAAQAYINEQGLHSLVMFLKDKLDTTGKPPTAAHQALARLPISLVLTANYDDLLERAYRDAGKRVHIVVRDSDIPFMRREPDAVNIVKLYGDLDQPDTIVLARQQYEAFFLQRPQMVKLLETELGRSHVLYLGWSHSDPHFNLVFGELLNRFGDFMRTGHAVMFDLPEARRKELERKHIRLVQLPAHGDRTGQLAAWLNSLTPAPCA